MSLENLVARRERLLYRRAKYREQLERARRLHDECSLELESVTKGIEEAVKGATESLARTEPKPGDVKIGVPTAVIGLKSEG